MTKRFYSTLEIKAVGDAAGGKRVFTGIASTPSTDRMDDIVEPKGAVFKLPIPFLWQHSSRDPIGWITAAKVTDKGIDVEGEVASVEEPGALQDRLTMAWQMLKAGLVRGLSIGFRGLETAQIEGTWGSRYLKWEWLELSAVTIPANADASITAIKSADDRARRKGVVRLQQSTEQGEGAPSGGATPPKSQADDTAPAATGQVRKGVVRLADPPGASGITNRLPA
jgi:HK97 family phage prohead protease